MKKASALPHLTYNILHLTHLCGISCYQPGLENLAVSMGSELMQIALTYTAIFQAQANSKSLEPLQLFGSPQNKQNQFQF